MASTITWLDHDETARARSLQLLSFFREQESRDELGIGGIRDAIADTLFPGTSTIQTRLRYMFFVPWAYAQLEARSTGAANFQATGRHFELRLLEELVRNSPLGTLGIIGREAGSKLQRLPSSVYWSGLGAWGLRRFPGTQSQYFAQVEQLYAVRRARRRREDGDEHDGDVRGDSWHPRVVELMPGGFPTGATLELSTAEAALLLDRWRQACPDSLLTWLALEQAKHEVMAEADQAWSHPWMRDFPPAIRLLLDHARRFAILIEGAALLYNLQLAELGERTERIDEYSTRWVTWVKLNVDAFQGWNLASFWPLVLGHGHSIGARTQGFVSAWLETVRGLGDASEAPARARDLVRQRERTLKGARSRFDNRAALNQWGGASGVARMDYRWPTARGFLRDWHAAMHP